MNTKVKFINKIICILIITIIVWNISLASYAAMTTYSNGIRLSKTEQEKSKLFLNTEFTYGKYNNTNKANTVFQFLLPAETSLNSSNMESYNDIIDVGDGLVVVGDSYISKYETDSKYYKENYLNKAKGNQDAIILKYDYNLNMKSFETFGGGLNESFKEIYQTKDGGYLAFGQTCSTDQDLLKINYNTSSYQDMAVKYDKNFNVILAKVGKKDQLYKENESQIIENKRISNGQIILNTISDGKVGVFTGVNGDEMNSTITKYDNVGHIEWAKTFDRNSKKTNDNLKKYVETNDAYIFVGSSSTKVKNKYNQEITVQDAIIVKYNKPYDQIIINGIILEMNIGTQRKADVFYIPWEDVTIGEMNWISENEDVATVDYKGNITAQKEGITKIHLDVRGKKAEIRINVIDTSLKHIENITLNKSELTLEKGKNETLVATIEPFDTTDSKVLTWTSSNPNVAIVEDGKITAVGEGEAIITVTVGEKNATCTVTVQKEQTTEPENPINPDDPTNPTNPDINYLLGDVDENGEVDAQDAVMVLKYVAHNITLTEKQLLAANTTKDTDGTVDAQDAVQILKYVAHNITEF